MEREAPDFHRMVSNYGDQTKLYKIIQLNGQLISTRKNVAKPPRGTEIFLKHLPRDALLQEIYSFVLSCGEVFQIRMLMDFSGYNRGYGYVTFFDSASARRAICTLNGAEIRAGHEVVVKLSLDNNKLLLQNLPSHVQHYDILNALHEILKVGLRKIIMVKATNETAPRKCILHYYTHQHALDARKAATPSIFIFDAWVDVDWCIPQEVLEAKRIYFKNAPIEYSKLDIFNYITQYIDVNNILNIFKKSHFGYILLKNQTIAIESASKLNNTVMNGNIVEFSINRFYIPEFNDQMRSNMLKKPTTMFQERGNSRSANNSTNNTTDGATKTGTNEQTLAQNKQPWMHNLICKSGYKNFILNENQENCLIFFTIHGKLPLKHELIILLHGIINTSRIITCFIDPPYSGFFLFDNESSALKAYHKLMGAVPSINNDPIYFFHLRDCNLSKIAPPNSPSNNINSFKIYFKIVGYPLETHQIILKLHSIINISTIVSCNLTSSQCGYIIFDSLSHVSEAYEALRDLTVQCHSAVIIFGLYDFEEGESKSTVLDSIERTQPKPNETEGYDMDRSFSLDQNDNNRSGWDYIGMWSNDLANCKQNI